MNLEKQLEKLILIESEKLILRYHTYHNNLHKEHLRNKKRFGTSVKKIKKPEYWDMDKKFNPFYVKRKAKSIAKSVSKKILDETYVPNSPHLKKIPKDSGGNREVTIYQIHDAAVSKLYYYKLLNKNKHRFSSFSYAYRHDRNVHFAIQDIGIDIIDTERTFIAEFDFSKFFDSISHEYLKKQFKRNGFIVSQEDEFIINSFLDTSKKIGIPQGTSISLFLANLVCWDLDKNFEKEGLKFARYADDTIIWSPDYSKICNAFSIINNFSNNASVKINPKKSDGISLLTKKGLQAELKNTKFFIEFLGYSISVEKISIKNDSADKIKKQITHLIYINLIKPLKIIPLKNIIIPNADNKDPGFKTAIMQIRRYLYGGLTDEQLINFIQGKTKRICFKGIMSFYPLVNDEQQLKELDGWLLSIIFQALKLRKKLLMDNDLYHSEIEPFCFNKKELSQKRNIPSFILIYKALKKGIINEGIELTMNPKSNKYNY